MRRAAPLLLAALLLSACGSEGSSSEGEAFGDIPAVKSGVTVEGEAGKEPTLEFGGGDAPDELQRTLLEEGDGEKVENGDLLIVNYLGQVWGSEEPFDASYERGEPAGFPIGVGQVIPGWDKSLVGVQEGSRVLLAIPPADGYGEAGQPEAGIEGDDTLVFVIDVIGSYGAAEGADPDAEVKPNETGVEVGGTLKERPTITVPAGFELPAETTTTVLAEGNGPAVEDGTLVLQYEVVDPAGTPLGSTWEEGQPTSGPVAAGGPGPFDALVGLPVGSRVLILAPADPADPQAQALVIVADIVGQPKS